MKDDGSKPCAATPAATLEQHIMDPNIPKSEVEWWAARKIESLQHQIEASQARIAELEGHLDRVLHRYSGAWHPDSIFQQEYGHEIDAARAAIRERTGHERG